MHGARARHVRLRTDQPVRPGIEGRQAARRSEDGFVDRIRRGAVDACLHRHPAFDTQVFFRSTHRLSPACSLLFFSASRTACVARARPLLAGQIAAQQVGEFARGRSDGLAAQAPVRAQAQFIVIATSLSSGLPAETLCWREPLSPTISTILPASAFSILPMACCDWFIEMMSNSGR